MRAVGNPGFGSSGRPGIQRADPALRSPRASLRGQEKAGVAYRAQGTDKAGRRCFSTTIGTSANLAG